MVKRQLVKAENIVLIGDIADRLGVTKAAVQGWIRQHPDFPAPVAKLKAGQVYDFEQVAKWRQRELADRGRRIEAEYRAVQQAATEV